MNPFEIPKTGATADWLIFIVMLLALGIPIFLFTLWLFLVRKPGKKRRRRHKHRRHRRVNPTLAEKGGLPPVRDKNEPPPGP